jgi:hypothetical protein
MKIDDMIDKIVIKPEEFKLKHSKNQTNSIMLNLNDNSIEPRKIFYYDALDDLALYPLFLDCLYCNEKVTCSTPGVSLQQLREQFKNLERSTIEQKIKTLFDLLHFDDNIDTTTLKNKIKILELKLK